MIKCLIATALLSFSISAATQKADSISSFQGYIQGTYNFNDSFNYDEFQSYLVDHEYYYFDETYLFDWIPQPAGQPQYTFAVPCSLNNQLYYIHSINLFYESGDDVYVEFVIGDGTLSTPLSYEVIISNNVSLSGELSWTHDFMFVILEGFNLPNEANCVWDFFFTHNDNQYLTTYNGYYSFANYSSTNYTFTAFGSVLYKQNIYIGLGISPVYNSPYSDIRFVYNNVMVGTYEISSFDVYSMPFPIGNNVLCNNLKMSLTSKSNLERIGVFAYVRDTSYDNADWQDLLFSVMDSPIYMINRLLSFEIFGLNLFVALAGLLTICALLILIKRFF